MSKPETPLLTVDAVIVYKERNLILIRRKNPPYQGQLALPGGFVDIGETVEDACVREAKEETNINVKIDKLIGVYSNPERDPRGHTVSIAFLCVPLTENENPKAQDDAAALEIVPITNLSSIELAFDHNLIVKDSEILKTK
ncbi:MAG: NUDIX domain-containing protein [Candidatus Lokiarchaeota archaeon]|nr:NUDIX domain-containing protein [Candidatus Lokiarchaeota archaeon]MBD3339921.1 NUDIX domain-containing protein [Candidatus Lokiarchaeota archaeon]